MSSSPTSQTLTCQKCGAAFVVPRCRAHKARFCSWDCYRGGRSPVTKSCEQCSKPFTVQNSKKTRARFCSLECRTLKTSEERRKPKIRKACSICGKAFVTSHRRGGNKTCSKKCAAASVGIAGRKRGNKERRSCQVCGKPFLAFPCREDKYCSRSCGDVGRARSIVGKLRTSVKLPCGFCGKEVVKYKSRAGAYSQAFCNNKCYHAWDKAHKGTEDQKAKTRARTVQMIADGVFGSPSKIEGVVSDWMTAHNIEHAAQVPISGRFTVDFKVGDVLLEVNGCYWHGCSCLNKPLTTAQKIQRRNDTGRATYCRNRGLRLLVIWEHDIRRGDFTALDSLLETQDGQRGFEAP